MPIAESIEAGSIAQSMLKEFEKQAPVTRRYLERLPEDKLTWKPHEKSMTAGQLAFHIAAVPGRILGFVLVNPAPAPKTFAAPQPASHEEILKAFDETVATVRNELPKFSDAVMHEVWRLQADGKTVLEQPRGEFLRDVMFSHIYQHRGQLCVYLRLLNVAVPASWGPSADEPPPFVQKAKTT
ncbi:MAG TPA: DinB family protein [Terracidiphilus sp.]|nr:DinB family protein [Terracidiphilus sp.]